jgi:hypothetical protein
LSQRDAFGIAAKNYGRKMASLFKADPEILPIAIGTPDND